MGVAAAIPAACCLTTLLRRPTGCLWVTTSARQVHVPGSAHALFPSHKKSPSSTCQGCGLEIHSQLIEYLENNPRANSPEAPVLGLSVFSTSEYFLLLKLLCLLPLQNAGCSRAGTCSLLHPTAENGSLAHVRCSRNSCPQPSVRGPTNSTG